MFKLLFMVFVMTARVSRNPSEAPGYRLYAAVLLVIMGFLYHTRYFQFMYHFIWKGNIPVRVWSGKDIQNEVAHPNIGVEPAAPLPGNGELPTRRINVEPTKIQGNGEIYNNFVAGGIRGWIASQNHDQEKHLQKF